MAPTQYLRQVAEPVCRHEAGHIVVAKVLGFQTGGVRVTVLPGGGHSGEATITLPRPLPDLASVVRYPEDRAVVLCAGALAESLSRAGRADSDYACQRIHELGSAAMDYAKVREFINLLRNIRYVDQRGESECKAGLDAIENEIWPRAIALVEAEHAVIYAVSDALVARVKGLGVPFSMSEAEINGLPAVAGRFPSTSPSP